MTDQDNGRADEWRKALAKEAFNQAWDLIDVSSRSEDEALEMLIAAAASRYLWQTVGAEEQHMVGDWQVAHTLSLLGEGVLALRFASAALATAVRNSWEDWRKASCLEGMARAHAAAGHDGERDRYAGLCRQALAALDDPEDRELVGSQLESIPGVG